VLELCNSFACVAAIGNLSEQAGLALKKVLGCPSDGPYFF
jgi:hypothetical protein